MQTWLLGVTFGRKDEKGKGTEHLCSVARAELHQGLPIAVIWGEYEAGEHSSLASDF